MVTDVQSAVSHVRDDSVVAISGFNMATTPEYLIRELYERHVKTGHPEGIFILCDALPATPGRALDAVAARLWKDNSQRFLKGFLIPYFGFSPWLQRLVIDDRVEAYSWPIGVTAYWFREIASGRPGLITKIGIDTLLDPAQDGGALNERGEDKRTCRVQALRIEKEDYLLYEAPKPDFALIRASTADKMGNLSMEDEPIRGTVLSMAQATKSRPKQGSVMAQVRRLSAKAMNPRAVEVPAPFVDYLVVSPKKYQWQSGTTAYDPRLSYKILPRLDSKTIEELVPSPVPYHRVIARRVLVELIRIAREKGTPAIVNLGVGIPALISRILAEENLSNLVVTALESGQWGGLALPAVDFGVALSPFALSTMPDMFSNFEGGMIDAASLGFLQVDKKGNVNPSMLPGRIFGPGGFPVIAGGAPRIYFAGSFTAGRSDIRLKDGALDIRKDGPVNKFVNRAYKVFFSGDQAIKYGKEIVYVTERAVFRLSNEGLVLEELAPGVDLKRHILSNMEFEPRVSEKLRVMEKELFDSR